MDLTGEYTVEAPRETVWRALNDPDVLRRSINGCESLERIGDDAFKAKVRAKIGPVSAVFDGEVRITDANPPASYTISGEGKGGAAGFAKGGADVALEPVQDGDATLLRYAAKADVGGRLAQLGARLVQGTARKMADEFFANFKAIVEGDEGAARTAAASASATGTPPPQAAAAPNGADASDGHADRAEETPMAGGAATGAPRLPEETTERPGQLGVENRTDNVSATPGGLMGAGATEESSAAAIEEANREIRHQQGADEAPAAAGGDRTYDDGRRGDAVANAAVGNAPSSSAGRRDVSPTPSTDTSSPTPLGFLGPGWVRWALIALVVIIILALLF